MESSLVVREAGPEDRATVARLTLLAYREYATSMEPDAWAALEAAVHASLADDAGVGDEEDGVGELFGELRDEVGVGAHYLALTVALGGRRMRRTSALMSVRASGYCSLPRASPLPAGFARADSQSAWVILT